MHPRSIDPLVSPPHKRGMSCTDYRCPSVAGCGTAAGVLQVRRALLKIPHHCTCPPIQPMGPSPRIKSCQEHMLTSLC